MFEYHDLVARVLSRGERRTDRTGTGTRSVFGAQCRYDLREGFPLLTTKKVMWEGVVRELLWFIRGSTNVNDGLAEHTPIWNAWADENGDLGPVYGRQWRAWQASDGHTVDQLAEAIETIKRDPTSRRIIVSAWNVGDLLRMALPPCHMMFQFYVAGGERLDLHMYQRSADLGLGVPFNIASYALLLKLVANECGLEAGELVHTIGDAHVYENHVDGMREMLSRTPYPAPEVRITPGKMVFDVDYWDIELIGYRHHSFIKLPVAV